MQTCGTGNFTINYTLTQRKQLTGSYLTRTVLFLANSNGPVDLSWLEKGSLLQGNRNEMGFARGSVVKNLAYQCRRPGFNPWFGKIPWRRKWQPTPVFLPGTSNGQRSLVVYSLWSRKRIGMTEQFSIQHAGMGPRSSSAVLVPITWLPFLGSPSISWWDSVSQRCVETPLCRPCGHLNPINWPLGSPGAAK